MSVAGFMDTIRELIRSETRAALPRWRYGTVRAVGPVRVELDADQGEVTGIDDLVGGLLVGDRVRVQTWLNRSTIVGKVGGPRGAFGSFDNVPVLTGDYSTLAALKTLDNGHYRVWNGATGFPAAYGFITVRRWGETGSITFESIVDGQDTHVANWRTQDTSVTWKTLATGVTKGWANFSWTNSEFIGTSQSPYTRNQWRVKNDVLYVHIGFGATSAVSTGTEHEIARVPIKNAFPAGADNRVWAGGVGGGGAMYGFMAYQKTDYIGFHMKPHTSTNGYTAPWAATHFAIPLDEGWSYA